MTRLILAAALGLGAALFLSAAAPNAHAPAAVAPDAIARETALLLAEKQALAETRAQIAADRASRVEVLEAHIAALARAASVTAGASAQQEMHVESRQRVRAALDDSRAKAAILTSAQQALARPTATLADAFAAARTDLSRDAHAQLIETLYFDLDGNLVQGTLLRLGPVAAIAASAGSAGPVVAVGSAWERVPASPAAENAARAAIERARAAHASAASETAPRLTARLGMIPLALGPADLLLERTDAAGRPRRSFFGATNDAGAAAWLALVLGAFALIAAGARAGVLARHLLITKQLGQSVADLVRRLELTRAAAACQRAGGASAEILAEIVRATTHVNQEKLEDRAIDLVLDENARTERMLAVAGILAAAALGVGAFGFASALANVDAAEDLVQRVAHGGVVLSRALLCAAPALLVCALGASLRARLRIELERAATNVVSAAQAAARDSFV